MVRAWTRVRIACVALAAASLVAAAPPGGTEAAPATGAHGLSSSSFERPRPDSRPTMLWFWNGEITEDLIDRQLADMRAEGIRETVIFPDTTATLQPAFFSEGWFDMIDHALREARRTGMKVWLFNDREFPSGRAAGIVVNGGTVGDRVYPPRPELRPQSIARSRLTTSGPGSFDLRERFPGVIPAQLSVADGRLTVDGGGVTLLNDGTEWTDYTLSFDTRPLETAKLGAHEYAQAGWTFRAQDPRNGYVYLLGNYPHAGATGGNITRITVVGGRNVATRVIKLPFDVVGGHSYHVETRVEGSRLVTSIDGTVVDELTDARFAHGTVGFRETNGQNESATFDDVRVTALDGSPLYEQTFDSDAALEDFSTPAPPGDVVAVAALPVRDGTPDADGPIDLTDRFRAGKSWSVPAGEHKVEYYVRHVRTDFGGNGYLNLFDEDAIRRYIDVVHDEYHRRFAWAFDSGLIRGFWDDEPRIATGYGPEPPWSDLVERNVRRAGSTPAQVLAAWYAEDGTAGRGARGVLSKADADALAQAYYKQQGDWARAHRTQIISNPLADDRPPSWMLRETGDIYKDNQWIQVPGGDAISGHVAPGRRDFTPRYITSAGHQQGAERILHENLGAYGWGVTPQLARYVNGSMGVRGVNLTVLHAYWSNPDSVRYPPPLEPSNPWWNAMDGVVDWTGRVMELTRGRAAAPTALLHPQSAAQAWQRTTTGDALDADFTAITYAMEDAQVDFDMLDEASLDGDPAMLHQAEVRGHELRIGPQAYRTVVVPPAPTMSVEAVRRLERLAARGGTVIAYGAPPEHETRGNDEALRAALDRLFARPGARRVATVAELQQALRDAGAPAARLLPAAPGVRVLRVMHGNDTVFVLMNEGKDAVDTTATFPEAGTPELWDPEDGSHRVAPVFTGAEGGAGTAIPLHLEPTQVLAVVFRGDRPVPHLVESPLPAESVTRSGPRALAARVSSDQAGDFPLEGVDRGRRFAGTAHIEGSFDPIPLDGTWRFKFERDGAAWSERSLGSWTAIDPGWSGDATYEKNVDVPAADLADGRRLILDLGDVRDVAHVSVNGTPAGRLPWAPYRLDVTDELHAGSNEIAVTVTNTPANAHGSAQASGLLGPVVLRPRQELTVRLEPRPEQCDPVVTNVKPATGVQHKWTHFGDRARAGEWAGGDGTYSAPLPDGRVAWLFNDTFLGPVGRGSSITPHAPVHNTIVTAHGRSGRPQETILNGTAEDPLPLVGPPGTEEPWYWNGDGIVDDGRLYLFEFQQQAAGEGHFGFEWIGTDLATFSLPGLDLESVEPTYDANDVTWGVELLRDGGHIYIYGQRHLREWPGTKEAYVARAPVGGLDGAWEFYTGDGWSSDEDDARPIAGDIGSSYGVSRVQGRYVLATTDSFLGSEIYLHTAPTPWGFAETERVEIYDTPEGQPEYDQGAEGDIYTYNVAAHPHLGSPNTLVLSYNVNSTSIDDLFADINNNRARFIEVRFAPEKRRCARYQSVGLPSS